MSNEKTYTLQDPITVGKQTISTVAIRPITVRQFRIVNKSGSDIEQGFLMVQLCADLSPEQMEEMTIRDFAECQGMLDMGKWSTSTD